jgi:uncharacterized membrane protein
VQTYCKKLPDPHCVSGVTNLVPATDPQELDDIIETFERTRLPDWLADRTAEFVGSWWFVNLHSLWFGIWVAWNLGWLHFLGLHPFDPFPFGLLTMIVSLEAIIQTTFLLIAQNRKGDRDRLRAEYAYRLTVSNHLEMTAVHHKLDRLLELQSSGVSPEEPSSLSPS